VQSIVVRKVGGEDRQVIKTAHRVVEIADGWKKSTDTSADEVRIVETSPKKVTIKTIRDGHTTTEETDTTRLVPKLDKFFEESKTKGLSLSEQISKLTGVPVQFEEEKTLPDEVFAGYACSVKSTTMVIKGERNQYVQWVPKDEQIQKAFPSLQSCSYRIIGEGGWLEHSEVVLSIKRVEK
jgi:hypothetical protein